MNQPGKNRQEAGFATAFFGRNDPENGQDIDNLGQVSQHDPERDRGQIIVI